MPIPALAMRLALLYLMIFAVLSVLPTASAAQTASAYEVTQTASGPIIEFTEGEFILSDGISFPDQGWEKLPNPALYRINETKWRIGDTHSLIGRFQFDRGAIGPEPIAIHTISTRNNITVLVNGTEIFRNFAQSSDQMNTWYRPILIPVPDDVLKPGQNEIVFKVYSEESLGIGRVRLGSQIALEAYHQPKFFWQITAPETANFAMLFIGMLVFLFWLGRRQEIELLWLSASTALWFLRNYQYYAGQAPFELGPLGMSAFTGLHIHASYFATAATAAFYLCFTKTAHRKLLISAMFILGVFLSAAHIAFTGTDLILYVPTTVIVLGISALGFVNLKRNFNIEHGVLGFTMMVTPLATWYDLYAAITHQGDGSATYVSIFGGLLYTTAFVISFGKRALDAFADLGKSNVQLERGIADTRAELAASEAARQELLVEQALIGERGRLMQEMHDGIGSNLVTALAVARKQKQPETTIKTLNRALSDLKITVDSLEPIEGDLIALIGNLRHRMSGDLRDAGIACKWEVEDCESLPWLDAANALHVLRIMQEAIGNVLSHSDADELRIGCKESTRDGVLGITSYVTDNGCGFDPEEPAHGKGLRNIKGRAQSLHGHLECTSEPGSGCIVRLWLPYERQI